MARGAPKGRRQFVDPGDQSSEPFRSLHLALELRSDLRRGKSILFTSPSPGDGKSTIAMNYALVAARDNDRRVLLVDADFRNPSLHEAFGVPRAPGLVDVLGHEHKLGEVAHAVPTLGHLDVLTVGSRPASAGDIAASSLMARLLDHARNTYDIVVVDSPPVLVAADAVGLASHPETDTVMVVRRSGKRRALVRALRRLDLIEANVLGLVVNRDDRVAAYAYS